MLADIQGNKYSLLFNTLKFYPTIDIVLVSFSFEPKPYVFKVDYVTPLAVGHKSSLF